MPNKAKTFLLLILTMLIESNLVLLKIENTLKFSIAERTIHINEFK